MAIELPELLVPDAPAWRAWLADHHDRAPGVWLVLDKQGGTVTSLTYARRPRRGAVLRLDRRAGHPAGRRQLSAADDTARPQERVVGAQRRARRPAGARAPDDRRRPSRGPRRAGRRALGPRLRRRGHRGGPGRPRRRRSPANPRAQAMFDVLTATNRYALIYRVTSVKRAETRSRKISAVRRDARAARDAVPPEAHPRVRRAGGSTQVGSVAAETMRRAGHHVHRVATPMMADDEAPADPGRGEQRPGRGHGARQALAPGWPRRARRRRRGRRPAAGEPRHRAGWPTSSSPPPPSSARRSVPARPGG